jgi:hypothetical protein
MEKTYYIYHIPGIKIGCTSRPEQRIKEQGFQEWEIIEEHSDINLASSRERELQKQYGYKVDSVSYSQISNFDKSPGGKVGGQKSVESGHLASIQSAGGKTSGKIICSKIHTCPHCGRNDLKGPGALTSHSKKCSKAYL